MMRDLSSEIKCSRGFSPVAAQTDNTAIVSQIIDTLNFDSLTFAWIWGSIADVDVTFTNLMEESNDSALATKNDVADADLIGTEAAGVPLFSDDNKVVKIGYKGNKRYVRCTITPAANTGNIFVACVVIQGHPRTLPEKTQVV